MMGIFAIPGSIVVAIYEHVNSRAAESAQKNNLFTLRTAVDEFTYDRQRAPRNLQELVSSGYLRSEKEADRTPYSTW